MHLSRFSSRITSWDARSVLVVEVLDSDGLLLVALLLHKCERYRAPRVALLTPLTPLTLLGPL